MDERLLPLLICPATRQPLRLAGRDEFPLWLSEGQKEDELLATADGSRAYPIRDGIPLLLDEEALIRR